MPLANSAGAVLIGLVLIGLASLQLAYASRLLQPPWETSRRERRQGFAFAAAFLLLGIGRLVGSDLIGGLGLIPLIVGATMMFRRYRAGEEVPSDSCGDGAAEIPSTIGFRGPARC